MPLEWRAELQERNDLNGLPWTEHLFDLLHGVHVAFSRPGVSRSWASRQMAGAARCIPGVRAPFIVLVR